MKISLYLFLGVSTLFFQGCDPAYRIRREKNQLNYAIPFDCLTASIKKIPSIKIVSASVSINRYSCKEGQTDRQVTYYTADGEEIALIGCYEKETLKTFSQYTSGWVGQKPKNVPSILEKMREVELKIEKQCGAKGLSSQITNDCHFISCGE